MHSVMKDTCISQAGEPAATPQPESGNPFKSILVVDDERVIRKFNARVLTHFGYQVDTAEDGDIAWDALQLKNYDLLVTDNDMPRVTGVELLKKVHEAGMSMPVIMATAVPPAEFTRAPWLHPAAMLLKPYSIEKLVGTVTEVLRMRDSDRLQIAPPALEPPSSASDSLSL